MPSLVPTPPLCLPSVCIHNNTQERKTGEKRGRPGRIHHVSGSEVDIGGGGRDRYSNMYILNLKASFLPVKTTHANIWSPKL